METGLSDQVWSVEEIIGLLDAALKICFRKGMGRAFLALIAALVLASCASTQPFEGSEDWGSGMGGVVKDGPTHYLKRPLVSL
jgi:hypothetical protein